MGGFNLMALNLKILCIKTLMKMRKLQIVFAFAFYLKVELFHRLELLKND